MRPIVFLCARAVTSEDVEIMLRLCCPPSRFSSESREVQKTLWQRLWQSAVIHGIVMEDLTHQDNPEALGILTLVLILPELATKLVRPGGPHLIEGIIDASRGATEPLPTEEQIGEANAKEGLDTIFCWIGYANEGYSPETVTGLRSRVVSAYNEFYQGNRIHSLLMESDDAEVLERFRSYGYEVVREEGGWTVMGMTRQTALNGPDIASQRLFSYDPPVLGFTASQRAILLLARQGYTDQEIASFLGKSPDSVKKRWGGIYARFAAVFPGRLPSAGDGSRGMEKRRTLLAYLKDRPEELRPYRHPGAKDSGNESA